MFLTTKQMIFLTWRFSLSRSEKVKFLTQVRYESVEKSKMPQLANLKIIQWKWFRRTTASWFFLLPTFLQTVGECFHWSSFTSTTKCKFFRNWKNFSIKLCLTTIQPMFCLSFQLPQGKCLYIKLWSDNLRTYFFRWHGALQWWGEHSDLCSIWFRF